MLFLPLKDCVGIIIQWSSPGDILKPAGISMLDGKEYYRLSVDIPAGMWNQVKSYFEDFGQEGTMQGMLTCEPGKVAEALNFSWA